MTSVAFASRLQAGDSDDGCSDLNQVVARIEQSIASIAGAGVGLQFALSPNAVRVAVDAIALEQIVLGLCAEAASLLSPGGRLVIETRGLNDAHLASPWAAIPAGGVRPRVIVRAEQLGHSPPPSAVRTARSEVELGRADLEALLDRHGGRFELVPLSENDLAYVAHLPHPPVGHSSSRMVVAVAEGAEIILLVEDEPQVQAITARILRAFGYSVLTAHDERTALAHAEQYGSAISLVVSDLVLPGVSGTDLVRRLRQPCEHARVLYTSGYSLEHVGELVEGASFLCKPFTAEELLSRVRDLLASDVG